MGHRLLAATALVLAPFAGFGIVWGGVLLAQALLNGAGFTLDATQSNYNTAFAIIGAVPFVLAVIWLVLLIQSWRTFSASTRRLVRQSPYWSAGAFVLAAAACGLAMFRPAG